MITDDQIKEVNWLDRKISTTGLKKAKTSTREFVKYVLGPKETKSNLDFGNCVELYILDKFAGTNEFEKQVAVFDEEYIFAKVLADNPKAVSLRATKIYKEERATFEHHNAGKYFVPKTGDNSLETLEKIQELVEKHPAMDLLAGDYQVAFEWVCPESGLKRYCRTDILNKDKKIIVDIKTDVSGDFERACAKNDYFVQADDHIEGALATGTLDQVEGYYWFVITTGDNPHVDVFTLDIDHLLVVNSTKISTLKRLKADFEVGPENVVWHDIPVKGIKVPNWYK